MKEWPDCSVVSEAVILIVSKLKRPLGTNGYGNEWQEWRKGDQRKARQREKGGEKSRMIECRLIALKSTGISRPVEMEISMRRLQRSHHPDSTRLILV